MGLSGGVSGSVQPWAAAPCVVTSVPAPQAPGPGWGVPLVAPARAIREADTFQGTRLLWKEGALPPHPWYLLEDFCRCLVRAIEYHVELLALLHLLQQRPGILVPRGELPDFDLNVISGRGFDELLQAN